MSTALQAEPVNYARLETSAALNLNPRQIAFVHHYLEVRVAWKAAELAGYAGEMNGLSATASNLLRNPRVQAYYLEKLKEMQVSSDEVLAELGEVARFPIAEMGEKCVVRPDHKLKALELAGKFHRLFVDKVETELAATDIDHLAESIINGLFAAAQQRAQAQQLVLEPAPTTSDSGEQP